MTTQAHIIAGQGSHPLKVTVQVKDAMGNWTDTPLAEQPSQILQTGQAVVQHTALNYVHGGQRLIIEEA